MSTSAKPEVELPGQVALDEDEHELARTLLSESREELTRADAKASMLIAALGIGISAILAAILAGDWSPFDLKQPYETIWWIGAAFASASFLCLCAAVYPKVKARNPSNGVAYFGDVAALETVAALRRALTKSQTDPAERSIGQLHEIARLVGRKYRFIRISLVALVVAIALTVGPVLAQRLIADRPHVAKLPATRPTTTGVTTGTTP